jgi:hypothetical protein
VAGFLTHLSVNRNVAPATQGQALNALVFLYRNIEKCLSFIVFTCSWDAAKRA